MVAAVAQLRIANPVLSAAERDRDPAAISPASDRETLVQEAGSCIQRIQKALTEMNLQLANVLTDISGMTGMRILHAIVHGERNP